MIRDKQFIRSLKRIYGDSWRYTLQVYKWMIRRQVPYLEARSLMRDYDHDHPLIGAGKNVVARAIVEVEGFENVEFLVDRKIDPKVLEYKEDICLVLYKTLCKRGYGFYKDILFFIQDEMLTCSRPTDKYYLDALLGIYLAPKYPQERQFIRRVMKDIDSGFDYKLAEEVFDAVPVDKSLRERLAMLLYGSKQYCIRVNECRITEALFYYMDDYGFVPGDVADFSFIQKVTRSFSGFEKKYEKLCRFFKLSSFPTGGLTGGGGKVIVSSNNFYEDYFVRGIKKDRAVIEMAVVSNRERVSFNPIADFLEIESKRIGLFDVYCGFYCDVFIFAHNPSRIDTIVNFRVSNVLSYKLEISSGDSILKWGMETVPLMEEGKEFAPPFFSFDSDVEIELNFKVSYRRWRGQE